MIQSTITTKSIRPLPKNVFVTDLESGPRKLASGLIIPDDDGNISGIHERWGKVYAIGSEVHDLEVGNWILIQHGRWTQGIDLDTSEGLVRVWRVEYPEAVLVASDEDPRVGKPTTL